MWCRGSKVKPGCMRQQPAGPCQGSAPLSSIMNAACSLAALPLCRDPSRLCEAPLLQGEAPTFYPNPGTPLSPLCWLIQ